MTNVIELLFDAALAVLLCVTIAYCGRLSARIRLLQDSRGELAGMITQFDQATGRAMTSLAELQSVSKRITDALQLKIEKANFLADDLAFLIEKSSKLATQLEQAAKSARPEPVRSEPARQEPVRQEVQILKPKPTAESLAYLETPPSPASAKPKLSGYPQQQGASVPSSVTSAASLEALLSRLAASPGVTPPPKPAIVKAPQSQGPRTGAERELLEALKSGR